VSIHAPTTLSVPLGTYASFRAEIYDPTSPYDNTGTWTAPDGNGSIIQYPFVDPYYTDATFYPYQFTPTTLTFRSNADPSRYATATIVVPTGTPLPDTGTYPDQADDCVSGDLGMRACESGQTYFHNLIFIKERGSRTDYLACTPGCSIKDNPGPNVTLSVSAIFFYRQTGTGVLVGVPAGLVRQTNTGHVDVKAWMVYFGNGGPPQIQGIDDIAGVCALHSASGGLGSRTAQDAYINGCRTF